LTRFSPKEKKTMTIKKLMRGIGALEAVRFIARSRRRSAMSVALPAAGLLAAGVALGAGIGLAFAPSSGRRLRQDVGGRLDQIRERVRKDASARYNDVNVTP
jgi:hypothetical protein